MTAGGAASTLNMQSPRLINAGGKLDRARAPMHKETPTADTPPSMTKKSKVWTKKKKKKKEKKKGGLIALEIA